ncbi:4'-phosphopantetheinyl transferase family protein [Streptomyces sp. NPDC056488]|uniref:4'-phosphopantetheinyl transferase family protein n=1 Tax=unclassified Streptomyces TaxID=2593676 RepID=UPI0036CF6CFF
MEAAATYRSDTGTPDDLDDHDVRVWVLRAPAAPRTARELAVLDEAEHRRLAAFAHDRDRALYGFAHVALRTVLSALTGVAPGDLRFTRAPCPCCGEQHGRPVLVPAPLEFSLSHSRGLVLIGTASTPIGIDAELVPEPQVVEELTRMLHPAERAEIESAPLHDRPAVFARLWARKEAYLKGLGTGLGRDLSADDVRADLPGWRFTDLPAGPGHKAAVAVASPAPRGVRIHRTLPTG